MTTKDEFFKKFDQEVQAWEGLLAEIGEGNMETPGFTELWTVKDVIAHITGWRIRTVAKLQSAKRNDAQLPPPHWPASLADDEKINDWIYETNKDRSLKDVLTESREVTQQMRQALYAFTEEELNNPDGIRWFEGEPVLAENFFGHFHEEHEADLRRWAATNRA